MIKFRVTTAMGDTYDVTAKDFLGAEIAGNIEIAAQGEDDFVENVDIAPGECASKLWPVLS